MTALSSPNQAKAHRSRAATLGIAIVAGSTVFGLLIGAVTFGALAIAFPLAVPIAHQYHVAVSANDMLIADRFAHLWPVFAVISIATFVAAVMTVIKTASYLERRSTE